MTHHRRSEPRKSPRLGLLVIVVTGTLFWGCVAVLTGASIHHVSEGRAYRQVCDRLVASGWRDVTPTECVALFRSVPE